KPDFRPAVLVVEPEGQVATGNVPFRDVMLAATAKLLDSLGYRTIVARDLGGGTGFLPPSHAARAAAAARAKAVLMMRLQDVDFNWSGVLVARGKLHLVAIGADGRTLMNRDIATDTVVGSRGDRQDALVRFVVAQALDISRRELAGALK